MTITETTLLTSLTLLGIGILACAALRKSQQVLVIPVLSSALNLVLWSAVSAGSHAETFGFGKQFILDPLSTVHIHLVNIVFLVSSVYAAGYFTEGKQADHYTPSYLKRFSMLWQGFHLALLAVLTSNNIGLLWVALEATTLVSALLILSDAEKLSIEAMWKYLLICSVGVVCAFVGTILITAASRTISGGSLYLWSDLRAGASLLDPGITLLAFIFILVGFGTKAGLAPMHTWLPDAHSQAPTPVSAVFSGVMLNCALYCIMRYLPIVETALGNTGEAHKLVLVLGLLSLVIAAVYIPMQTDIKRLLAYSSVEHIGIMAVSLGIGGVGTFACLLHALGHSLCKPLAFFSAGKIVTQYGTKDLRTIRGSLQASPLWGKSFAISVLALIGIAPFTLFMSEFLAVSAAFQKGHFISTGVLLFSLAVVFVSFLKHMMGTAMAADDQFSPAIVTHRRIESGMVALMIVALIVSGVYLPNWASTALKSAAMVIDAGGGW